MASVAPGLRPSDAGLLQHHDPGEGMKPVYILLALAAGIAVTIQAPLNAELGRHTGPVTAAVVSFSVGLIFLLGLAAVLGQLGDITRTREVSWPYLLGGLIGAFFVTTALLAVPKIGAGSFTAAAVSGQLVMAVIVDRFGWLDVPQQDLSPTRLVGVGLLLAGVWLVSLS